MKKISQHFFLMFGLTKLQKLSFNDKGRKQSGKSWFLSWIREIQEFNCWVFEGESLDLPSKLLQDVLKNSGFPIVDTKA